jgi:hypothetical protein
MYQTTKGIPELLKIMGKILEQDWHARNLNKTFKTSGNVYIFSKI